MLYYLHSNSVLSFYIDVVLTLPIGIDIKDFLCKIGSIHCIYGVLVAKILPPTCVFALGFIS